LRGCVRIGRCRGKSRQISDSVAARSGLRRNMGAPLRRRHLREPSQFAGSTGLKHSRPGLIDSSGHPCIDCRRYQRSDRSSDDSRAAPSQSYMTGCFVGLDPLRKQLQFRFQSCADVIF
jgi:hypothetical protein